MKPLTEGKTRGSMSPKLRKQKSKRPIAPPPAPKLKHNEKLKYNDYKGVIKIVGPDGKTKAEFTTFRSDIIMEIMRAGMVLQAFESGDTLNIVAGPNEEE